MVYDVTRLRRLENLRRDFVANVSHELKTPITAIKGAVETLLDGAMDNPQDNRHFLEIAGRQADRLNAIVEDLLSLFRLEREAETEEVPRTRQSLLPILSPPCRPAPLRHLPARSRSTCFARNNCRHVSMHRC